MSNSIEIKNGTTVNLNAPEKSAISLSVPERSITNVTIGGLKAVGKADASFEYTQNQSSKVWEINHNLNKKPSVTVVDSGDNVVVGEVQYIDNNNLTVSFNASFSGNAYLN